MTSACHLTAVLLASIALAAAAGEPAPLTAAPLLGSCTVPGALSCTDFEKAVGAGARDACIKYKLTWSEAACPTAKVVGTCVKKEGGGRSFTRSYSPGTPDIAKKACTNTPGGTFVP